MIGFLIKKAFFDFWDNLLRIVLINLGFVVIIGLGVYLPYLLRSNIIASMIVLFILLAVFHLYVGGASYFAKELSDYKTPGFREFFSYIKLIWRSGLFLSALATAEVFVFVIAFPFYLSVGNLLGVAAIAILFWISLGWLLASQYYFPIRCRLEDKQIRKVFKKTFILFLDNTFFTIFLGIGTAATFIISIFTAFLLPGFAGIILWHQVAFKLRLYKYDYLEEHPEADKKNIPWEALLFDDKQKVGPRTFKGMIFPWKD